MAICELPPFVGETQTATEKNSTEVYEFFGVTPPDPDSLVQNVISTVLPDNQYGGGIVRETEDPRISY